RIVKTFRDQLIRASLKSTTERSHQHCRSRHGNTSVSTSVLRLWISILQLTAPATTIGFCTRQSFRTGQMHVCACTDGSLLMLMIQVEMEVASISGMRR